jgi:N-acetylglucosamine malate deacetylase 1
MARILVISPHPDDESIGCGGTLRRHVEAGDPVKIVFLTSGENGGHGRPAEKTAELREGEAKTAARILGIEDLEFWRQPDGKLRASRALVERLTRTIKKCRPTRIYAPHANEMHPDHGAAFRAVIRAAALLRGFRPEVMTYEVWTPLQQMTEIVDISGEMECKLRAIRAYRTQGRVMDFAAAAHGLARYRGEMHSWPGGDYAEVFLEERW